MKETLIIVDFQNDFCKPNGALYVNGAVAVKENLIDYLKENKDKIDNVILTRDWHCKEDTSFKDNGGIWPVHCVQNEWGSEVDPEIIDALNELDLNYVYSNKGTNPYVEEYGGFSFITETEEGYALQNVNDSYVTIIPKDCTNVKVCGIAGDYCVYETTKNLVNSGFFNVSIILDCVVSIDGGTKITEYSKTL